jgi:flagellin-like protein
MENKKALSPVITTILLVLLAIILAVIILLWFNGFNKERLIKFDGTEDRPVEEVCDSVDFSASLSDTQLVITNIGNIPIYKISVKLSGFASSEIKDLGELNIIPGDSKTITVDNGDKITKIIPILLASSKDQSVHEYTCPKTSWKDLQ